MAERQKKKKRRTRPLFRILVCLALLGASGYFIFNIVKEGVTTYTLQVDISQARSEIAALEKENNSLQDQKDKLQDTNYVENYARGEYMITKKGEEIYHLPAADQGSSGQ